MSILNSAKLGNLLQKKGLIPKHCRLVEAVLPVSGAITLKFETYVDVDQMAAFLECVQEAYAEDLADRKRQIEAAGAPHGMDPD